MEVEISSSARTRLAVARLIFHTFARTFAGKMSLHKCMKTKERDLTLFSTATSLRFVEYNLSPNAVEPRYNDMPREYLNLKN